MIQASNWKPSIKNFLPLSFLAIYFFIRFYVLQRIEGLDEYASYYFEVGYVVFVLFYYRDNFRFNISTDTNLVIRTASSLILGIATYFGAGAQGIAVPFDLAAPITLVFLLLIGPVLEELIFRGVLWFSIEHYFRSQVTLVLTAAIFAFSHFHAYFFVPEEFHRFIYYQTIYTFIVALLWGLRFIRTKNLFDPILLHMAYNFGFYIGFLIRR